MMAKRSTKDPRLTRLTEIAVRLPEATRKLYGSHAQFLVRKKTFAYFLDNHHGDGIVAVTGKVLPGDNKAPGRGAAKNILFTCIHRVEGLGRAAAGRRQSRLERGRRTAFRKLRFDRTAKITGAGED